MSGKTLMLGKRNQLTLPKELIPDGTTLFACELREDGSLLLTPQVAIPAGQAWFWSKRWQEGELKASEDVAAGRVRRHASANELVSRLKSRRRR